MSGVLHGVGVGPGDPELMTLKASRLISEADVIAYPALEGVESLALSIAREFVSPSALEYRFDVPMSFERDPAQRAYDRAASDIAAHLESGRSVAALCEGDPFFYGSFMYLFARLSGRHPVHVVPGVSSMTACAAAAGLPLAARSETLAVIPATLPHSALASKIADSDTAALIKVGRHLAKVREVLRDLGLSGKAVYVERATLGGQRVAPLEEAPDPAPYFSMILVVGGADPWL